MRKVFLWTIVGLTALETVSFLTFRHTTVAGWIMLITLLTLGVVVWKRPWILPLAMLAELAIGGHGYLLSIHWHGIWPLRLGLFVLMVVMTLLRWRTWKLPLPPRMALLWPLALVAWVGLASLWGLAQLIPPRQVFLDMNVFLFLPVVGLWWSMLRLRADRLKLVIAVLSAGVTVTAILGLLLVIIFGSDLNSASSIYSWIWRTKTGEIFPIGTHLFRVFLQSQMMGLLLGFVLVLLPRERWERWMWVPMVAGVTSVWISLSRSFWLGAAVGLCAVISYLWWHRKDVRPFLKRAVIAVGLGYFLFSWAGNFPNPIPWLANRHPLSARISNVGSNQAAEARLNQIKPLVTAIERHPVWGRGFGTTVTFFSPDPRTNGYRTASAFELGYLDWWLDMGMVGMVILGGWLITLLRKKSSHQYLVPSVIALFAVHLTTLYLNHPIGIGWLAVATLFFYDHE
jgi:hypothetical protein